jgi:ABC-type nickel/cobalt efflux system permease component RcnA
MKRIDWWKGVLLLAALGAWTLPTAAVEATVTSNLFAAQPDDDKEDDEEHEDHEDHEDHDDHEDPETASFMK